MTEAIFGLDITGVDAERLMFHIDRRWTVQERILYPGKWFDYRFINPVQATCLYAHEFAKAWRQAFKINVDGRRAQYIKPIKPELFRNSNKVIAGLWRGRMVADAMMMPYDVFLQRAFFWNLRYWRQKHLPLPCHLYSDLVTDRTTSDWESFRKDRLYFSKHANYRNENYCGLSHQDDHHEWLFTQLMERGNPPAIVAQLVYDEELLPIKKVSARLGDDLLNAASALRQTALSN